jgi:hypothetical protein
MNAHKQSAELEKRIARYLSLHGDGAKIKNKLGEGTDGTVWATDRDTAIKAFKYDSGYVNERDTYQRLADHGVTEQIAGFWIPKMLGSDDELRVIEMDIVQKPPYIIDFAKVRLNSDPGFSTETLAENDAHGRWLFGKNWPIVKMLMAELETYLIYYLDPKPHNIVFPNPDEDGPLPPHL